MIDPAPYARQFARAVSLCEDGTESGHAQRVERLTERLMAALPRTMLPDDSGWWPLAMLPHDFGKVFLPAEVWRKPGPLLPWERVMVEQHTLLGRAQMAHLAREFHDEDPETESFWLLAALIAGGHHERLDGQGYPHGLKGDQVPMVLRVARVVDVFDALTFRRSYRDALSHEDAMRKMRDEIGGFDDRVLAAMDDLIAVGVEER